MTRKILGRVSAVRPLVFAFVSLAALALQAVSTSYINSSGVPDTADCTEITSSSTTLNTGWYVVNGEVTISSYVTVNGDVNLILADGANLTVNSSTMDKAGICVYVDDEVTNSLSIYCQSAGTGELHASSSSYGPGIGTAGEDGTCGIVTIYGGNVYATGSKYGSGIGSGWKGAGGTVTINGGTVTAIGGSSAGAGIGGGYQGAGGTVIVNGGFVTATAGNSSYAGIGGQSGKDQGSLTVGGNVVVMAGNSESLTDSDIQNPNGETSISLATIYQCYQVDTTGPKPLSQVTSALVAYAGELFNISLASTISGGSGSYTFSGTVPDGVTLNDGVLTGTLAAGVYNFTLAVTDSGNAELTPPASYTLTVSARPKSITYKDGTTTILGLEPAEYTPGTPVNLASYVKPGYTFLGWYDNDGLSGDPVTAVSAAETEDLTFWASCSLNTYTIQYYDGTTLLTGLAPTSYTITQTPVGLPTPEGEDGYTFAGWCTTSGCTDAPITSIAANSTGDKIFYAKWTSNTPEPGPSGDGFIADDPEEPSAGTAVQCRTADGGLRNRNCTQITSWTTCLSEGWYYVTGDVEIESSVTVDGKVSLVLCDDATLTIASSFGPGINVVSGNTLTIYGQNSGNGKLIVSTTDSFAAIGGGSPIGDCGKINIYGGDITATASDWAAGIGGDYSSSGGAITIMGGKVTAISGSEYVSGIGAYYDSDQGSLTVGGNVVVKAGADESSAEILAHGEGGTIDLGSARPYFYVYVDNSSVPEPDPEGDGFIDDDPEEPTSGTFELVNCRTADGKVRQRKCLPITSAYSVTLNNNWYYVAGDVEIDECITVNGNVSLVLCDGAKLTVDTFFGPAIKVVAGNTLTIYGQTEGSGQLIAHGVPAIGSGEFEDNKSCGKVNVYGGVICAEGESYAPGIGGVDTEDGTGGAIYIYGGTVTAKSGDDYYAGIGAYKYRGQGTLTVGEKVVVHAGANEGQTEILPHGEGGAIEISTKVNGLTVIYPYFYVETLDAAPAQSTITYMDGVEELTDLADTYTEGTAKDLAVLEDTDAGMFAGWCRLSDLSDDPISALPDNVTGDMTLYAKWVVGDPVFTVNNGKLSEIKLRGSTSVTIPSDVTTIQASPKVFMQRTAITSVTIPGTVKTIGSSAFGDCTGLANITINNGVEDIEGDAFANCTNLVNLTIPGSVTNIGEYAFEHCTSLATLTLEDGIKTIGDYAFSSCTALTGGQDGLYFPDSIESIGDYAFRQCSALNKVSLPGSLYVVGASRLRAFDYDTTTVKFRTDEVVFDIEFYSAESSYLMGVDLNGHTEVVIPEGVTMISTAVFKDLTTLKNVTFPSTLKIITSQVFEGCTGLTSIDIPSNVEELWNGAFASCSNLETVAFHDGMQQIDAWAFHDCPALKTIRIPPRATVKSFAFDDCTGLESAYFGIGAKVEPWAFDGCTNLRSVCVAYPMPNFNPATLDDGSSITPVNSPLQMPGGKNRLLLAARPILRADAEDSTQLGQYAFWSCRGLQEVMIGETVDSIGGGAFSGCTSIDIFTIDENNNNFDVVEGVLLSKDHKTLISGMSDAASVTVPNGVTNVLDGAFAGCETLKSVVMPSGVEAIGEAAFSNATVFATITIPQTVTTIGVNAFYGTVLATVNVAKGDAARVKALVEGTGYAGAVAYIEPGDEPTEWPEDTSTVASQTAAEAFGITEGPLTNVNAKALADWAKDSAKGNVSYAEIGSIIPDAFLLNCANTAAAVEAAEAVAEEAIKITAITFDSEGNPVLTCPEAYGNGQVVIKGSVDIGASASWHNKTAGDRFFKTILELK